MQKLLTAGDGSLEIEILLNSPETFFKDTKRESDVARPSLLGEYVYFTL